MMTVITETTVASGKGQEWDQAFQARLKDAREQDGWVGMELLIPDDEPNKRVVVGTWESQEHWERWHETETFKQTRRTMDEATKEDGQERWYRVVTETFQ